MKLSKDEFNTEMFQMKMGNLVLEDSSQGGAAASAEAVTAEIAACVEEAKKEGYRHLTVRVPGRDKERVNAFLRQQFYLADTLVEYVFDLQRAELPKIEHKCSLHDCRKEEVARLKEIAKNSFQVDRFHSDEHLDNELCDKYYETWMENSYHGFAEKVIVAEYAGEPVGFTTGKTYEGDDYGHLVLSAVSDKYRGIGVYTSMIYEGISWMIREHGNLKGVIVGTQLDTIAVQKAWIKLGFTVYDSFYVLHRYLGEMHSQGTVEEAHSQGTA